MIRAGSKLSETFILASRLAMGAMLLWTGIPKLLRPDEFLVHVQAYCVLGVRLAAYFAAGLPGTEILIAFCLIAGLITRGAFLLTVATFAIAIAVALHRGLPIDCGCGLFGGNEHITSLTLLRSSLLLLWALLAYIVAARVARQGAQASPEQSGSASPPVGAQL